MTDISDDQEYTVEEYMQLPENAPFQLIHGKLIYMPSPKRVHQHISMVLSSRVYQHVISAQSGTVMPAPFDVHFDKKNVFQPDLLFISNERKHILKDWVYGAPDLVVEILSEGTASKDRNEKMETYGKYNVLEYWVISPENQQVEVYENSSGQMTLTKTLTSSDTLTSSVLPGFEMPLGSLFQ